MGERSLNTIPAGRRQLRGLVNSDITVTFNKPSDCLQPAGTLSGGSHSQPMDTFLFHRIIPVKAMRRSREAGGFVNSAVTVI